ncbi:MAG TPA: hypothetical protein VFR12_05770 [Pyrinomonadaceae bacterium]|nr:hypothetical protein [Pyrinomonadaceae bacterium]
MRTLWIAMVLSVGGYYFFTLVAGRSSEVSPNSTLSLAFVAVALITIPVSFVVRKKFLTQAVDQQRPEIVQQGYIFALAIIEVGALLGLLDLFVTGNHYYFVPMIIAACGQLLHFPQRQHLLDACFKSTNPLR